MPKPSAFWRTLLAIAMSFGVCSPAMAQSAACQQLSDSFAIYSGKGYGFAPAAVRESYAAQKCTTVPTAARFAGLCQSMSDSYRIQAGKSWGSASADPQVQGSWVAMNCNTNPSAPLPANVAALIGTYKHEPVQNAWHTGKIVQQGNGLRWFNDAGVSWSLTGDLANNRLLTGADNPYYAQYPNLREFKLIVSNGLVTGFDFAGPYRRTDLSAQAPAAPIAAPQAPVAAIRAPAPVASTTPATAAQTMGRNVTRVDLVSAGTRVGVFRQIAPKEWLEYNSADAPLFRYEELRRDERSVHLIDRKRNMILQIDLDKRKVHVAGLNSSTWKLMYEIADASSQPVAMGRPQPVLAGQAGQAPKLPEFFMALISDPQYSRARQPDGAEDDEDYKQLSEANNRNHVKSINSLAATLPSGKLTGVIINGDLTEYGKDWQFDMYKSIYGGLTAPIYPGLGNHDYEQNVDNLIENHGANRMLQYMRNWIKSAKPTNFSYDLEESSYYEFPEQVHDYRGSLAYSWDEGGIHFVQLQNFPTYERSWSNFVTGVHGGGVTSARNRVTIKNSLSWLERDLAQARNAGKAIILNMHDPFEHWVDRVDAATATYRTNRFKNMLAKYEVSAVFAGHIHENIGEQPNRIPTFGYVPVLYCGSSIYRKYLLVNFNSDLMTVEQVDSTGGTAARNVLGFYKLKYAAPPQPFPLPGIDGYVWFKNEAGYVSRYYLSYMLGGQRRYESTGNLALGNAKKFELPGEATDIVVSGQGNTGLQDSKLFGTEKWKTHFQQTFQTPPKTCFKSYGTTLNQKWNNNCQ